MEKKRLLRQEMSTRRMSLLPESKQQLDRLLCQRLSELISEREPHTVHTYLPMPNEINFLPLIQQMLDNDIRVVAPKTYPRGRLEHLQLSSLDQVEDGVFGTRHPAGSKLYTGTYDLIIVPGLAFDRAGNRLGYGGGYYDRFLPAHPNAYKVALCYSFQLVEELPLEPHDIRMNNVLFTSPFESSNISSQK